MPNQLRLPLDRQPDYGRARFAVSAVNEDAVERLDGWRTWPGGALALIGPEGSGKTHLAHIWAAQAGAIFLDQPPTDLAVLRGAPVVIEDAETWPDAECLFHLLNMAQAGGGLLLTSRLAPSDWPAALADLRSRLNGLTVAELDEPDDAVLEQVLTQLFEDRHIRPKKKVIPYLLSRMERSVPAARALVARMDELAARTRREINRSLAAEALEIDTVTNDLFDRGR